MEGRDKLLEDVDGEPLLSRQLRRATATQRPVLIALPPGDGPRRAIADSHHAAVIEVADRDSGMSRSIAALASEAGRCSADWLLLHLADMPDIEGSDFVKLLAEAAARPCAIVRAATREGRPGHPVVFPARFFAELQRLTGDAGARDIIGRTSDVHLVRFADGRAATDLDTPADWSAWRASRE